MKAIEINTKTDKYGHLRLDYPLHKKDCKIRVIVLVDDKNEEIDEADEEKLWMKTILSNPAFSYLEDANENVYTITDGEPFND